MKRSEKEAEVRRLLETPGAVVMLPKGMSVRDIRALTYDGLVERLVREAEPEGGWEPEPVEDWVDCPNWALCGNKVCRWGGTGLCHPCSVFKLGSEEMDRRYKATHERTKNGRWPRTEPMPRRLRLWNVRRGTIGADDEGWHAAELVDVSSASSHPGKEWCRQVAQSAIDAYNAMKEAEEAEANPNDPLTMALERVTAKEVAKLIEDAVEVAMEETLKECVAKCTSKYTREEFVAAEIDLSLKLRDEEPEDIDPFALSNIRQRAEWNAQAAERVGVVWRRTVPVCECRLCKERRKWEQAQEKAEVEVEQLRQAEEETVPDTPNKAWMHYCDSGLAANHRMPRETFNAGFDYGYRAGWRARMDTLNPVCSPEAVDETLAAEEVGEIVSRLDRHTSSSAVTITLLRESIDNAHDRLQRHDVRITELREAVVEELNSLSEKLHAVERTVQELHPNKES